MRIEAGADRGWRTRALSPRAPLIPPAAAPLGTDVEGSTRRWENGANGVLITRLTAAILENQGVDRRRFLGQVTAAGAAMASSPLLGALSASRAEAAPLPAGPPGRPQSPPAGSSIRYLTCDPNFMDARPCFDPTGKLVLFMHQPLRGKDKNQIWFYSIPTASAKPCPFNARSRIRSTSTRSCRRRAPTGRGPGILSRSPSPATRMSSGCSTRRRRMRYKSTARPPTPSRP
jgi:hypothetical protein